MSIATNSTTAGSPPAQQALPQEAAVWLLIVDEITQTKLIASLVLFVITLLFGYLPVRIILNQNYIQHAMFAGGGVLMATAFCNLIPEAHDEYNHSKGGKWSQLKHQHSSHNHMPSAEGDHYQHNRSVIRHQDANNETIATTAIVATPNETTNTTLADSSITTTTNSHLVINNDHPLHVPYPEIALCCGFIFMYVVEQLFLRFVNNHTHEHPGADNSTGQLIGSQPKRLSTDNGISEFDSSDKRVSASLVVVDGTSVGGSDLPLDRQPHGSSSHTIANTGPFYKFIRGLLIVSAFSLHSIFDGVAIGSQDSIEKVWTIFAAISCHKLIIVAVVGFELFSATLESHLWTLIHLTIFSIMSPIGILLVVIAQNSLKISSDDPALILLQSFATGTLLYIIFVEILQPKEDRFHARNRPTKILSLILGFAAMVTVLTLMHEH